MIQCAYLRKKNIFIPVSLYNTRIYNLCVSTAFVASRAGRCVEGLNLGFDLGLHVGKECLHLLGITARQLILGHEPGDGVEIDTRHLEAEPRTFDHCGSAPHEDIEHPKLSKCARLLVIAIVMVPDSLGRLGGIVGRLGSSRDQQTPENAGAPASPPFGHLIDGFACITLKVGQRIDRCDGKVHFETDGRSLRITEVRYGQTNGLAEVGRFITIWLLPRIPLRRHFSPRFRFFNAGQRKLLHLPTIHHQAPVSWLN